VFLALFSQNLHIFDDFYENIHKKLNIDNNRECMGYCYKAIRLTEPNLEKKCIAQIVVLRLPKAQSFAQNAEPLQQPPP